MAEITIPRRRRSPEHPDTIPASHICPEVRTVVVACCLGLGSLLLLSHPKGSPDSTSVPLELTNGRAIVTVALNGRPYRLAVETGSPNVRVTSAAVRDLGLRGVGVEYGDSVFHLDSLGIGSVVVRGLRVARGDEVSRLGVDGVLGLDAYEDYLLTVDYLEAKLSLSSDTLPAPDAGEVLQAVRVGPFLGVGLDVGGVKEVGVVDTWWAGPRWAEARRSK
jgi:hypothetical protein